MWQTGFCDITYKNRDGSGNLPPNHLRRLMGLLCCSFNASIQKNERNDLNDLNWDQEFAFKCSSSSITGNSSSDVQFQSTILSTSWTFIVLPLHSRTSKGNTDLLLLKLIIVGTNTQA